MEEPVFITSAALAQNALLIVKLNGNMKLDERLFVSIDTAKALIDDGFNENCLYHYAENKEGKATLIDSLKYLKINNATPAPMIHQAILWIRDKYNVDVNVKSITIDCCNRWVSDSVNAKEYNPREGALDESILKLLLKPKK